MHIKSINTALTALHHKLFKLIGIRHFISTDNSVNTAEPLPTKNRKINILYISNRERFLGGAQRSLYDLISHLDRSKINPYFVSIYDGEVAESIKNLGVACLRINEFKRSNPLPYIYSQIQLIYLILTNKIKIIHNNQFQEAFYTWIPAWLTNTKIIIHHRDSSPFSKLDNFFIDHVDCNICVSSWQNTQLLNNKAILIHNGIDLCKIYSYDAENKPASPMLVKKELLIGLVGRISPIKGHDTFIKAAKIVLEKIPNAKFYFYGDENSGYYKDYYLELLNLIKSLEIEKKVLFRGFMSDIKNVYQELDISVVPSLREPCSRVLIESMAFSVPVIATSVGGALDLVTDETGILIPVNDPEALAASILYLIDNPAVRASMGKAGHERFERYFTIEKTLSKICEVYDNLLCEQDKK